ncbi:MAG TPA: nucleotidyltransferase domain-containing protein [Bacillota bacterium]
MPTSSKKALDAAAILCQLRAWAQATGCGRDDVELIILFGSLAKGTHTGRSDIDLLVVVRDSPVRFLERPCSFTLPQLQAPVDLFVYTRAEMAPDRRPPLAERALREGVVLFSRGCPGKDNLR